MAKSGGVSEGKKDVPPTFQEHVSICKIGKGSVYAENPKLFEALKEEMEALEKLEGVLAVHANDGPSSTTQGERAYVIHFRTVNNAARERVMLAAHDLNANFLLKVSEEARKLHNVIINFIKSLGEKERSALPEHHSYHKLSSQRFNTDFTTTAHADCESHPCGSDGAKFSALRVGLWKVKDACDPKIVDDFIDEVRSLPTRFPLLLQTSIGRNIASSFSGPQLYPETGVINWDILFIYAYASDEDREVLDTHKEFVQVQEKWASLLQGDFRISDLTITRGKE